MDDIKVRLIYQAKIRASSQFKFNYFIITFSDQHLIVSKTSSACRTNWDTQNNSQLSLPSIRDSFTLNIQSLLEEKYSIHT